MSTQVNVRELGALIRAKRGTLGLRATAKEVGEVSASTLSRIEQGKVPDLDTFMKICKWLDVSPEKFMPNDSRGLKEERQSNNTPQIIAAQFRADQTLDPATADALTKLIQMAYENAKKAKTGK
jgi:transcriptional regulator with XRE-family HTH domain